MGRHKGEPNKATKQRRSDTWRESIQASSLLKRLKDHADGKLEKPMDATQIKAAEIILARLVPTLSAVEQTIHEEPASESALLDQLKALISSNPEVAKALWDAANQPKPSTDAHVTH